MMFLWTTLVLAITIHTQHTVICLKVERIAYGESIDLKKGNLFDAIDYFSNAEEDPKFCAEKNSNCATSGCKNGGCCMCQCHGNYSFINFEKGCLREDSVNVQSGQNCKLRFVFVTQAKIPAFKDNHNDISVATGIPLSVKDGVSQDTYNLLHDYRSECVAEKVYEIHPHGGINIIDKNIKQSFFEIQNTYTAFTKIHNLKLNDMTYSRWKKMEGKLVSLDVNCSLSSSQQLATCILFKVNGSSIVDSTTSPSLRPTTAVDNGSLSTKKIVMITSKKIALTKEKRNTTLISSSEESSIPLGAIIGPVVGVILITIILIVIICIKRRSSRSKSKSRKILSSKGETNGSHDIPLFAPDQHSQTIKENTNPYYATGSDISDKNHYYSPGDVVKGNLTAEENNVYYSSADVIDDKHGGVNEKKPMEYSYARGNTPKKEEQEPNLKLQQSMRNNPGSRENVSPDNEERYQALTMPHLPEQTYHAISQNPIYSGKEQLYQAPMRKEEEYLALSTGNDPAYQTLLNKEQYLDVTSGNEAVYQAPSMEAGYVDMKSNDHETGEYMYADTAGC